MNKDRVWFGVGLLLCASVVLAATSVAAVISFHGGANPSAVVVIRFLGGVLVLYTLLLVSGAPVRLPRRARMIAFAIGAAQAVQSFGLYSSLDRIPVGLTMIIFYVFPLIVGVLVTAIGQERLTGRLVAALIIAFLGLVLVFNVTGAGLDLAGALFAGLAAIAWTVVVVFGTRLAAGGDSRPVTLHIQLSALILFSLVLVVTGEVRFPAAREGWVAFAVIPFLYGGAMAAWFAAAQIIGPVRSSLVMNFEAVAAIVLGYLVLGQTLTPPQLAGAAIVISALFVARRRSV
jgi:drug/metabolite transporter (DMT)-like permease